ncbi:MAG: hypothetical protein LOD92_05760 [Bacillales bacterium]
MNSLQDAVYNWLTIKVVCDHRPDDAAARETEQLFWEILKNEHSVRNIKVTEDSSMYYVQVELQGKDRSYRFPRQLVEAMLTQIAREPEKYKNFS